MKLKVVTTALLLSALPFIPLAITLPSLSQSPTPSPSPSQPDLNVQLQQALCAQNWGRTLQILDQMKRRASPEYASQITLYRGRIAAIARENAKVPGWTVGCSGGGTASGNPSVNMNNSTFTQPSFNREYTP
ncbi:MAG TPA: hypothetical protein V6C95_19425 [Coleofasciculaceae cyanobacterium]